MQYLLVAVIGSLYRDGQITCGLTPSLFVDMTAYLITEFVP